MKHIDQSAINLLQNGYTELEHIINNISSKENFVRVQSSKNPAGEYTLKLDNGNSLPKGPILYRWWVSELAIDRCMREVTNSKIKKYNTSNDHSNKYNITKEELAKIFFDDSRRKDNFLNSGKTYYALYLGKSLQGQERINQHVNGPIKYSTLRRTICGLFVELPNDSNRENEINNILADSFFEVLPLDDSIKGYIDCLESICIAFGHYPLNIEGNHFIDMKWQSFLKSSRKNLK